MKPNYPLPNDTIPSFLRPSTSVKSTSVPSLLSQYHQYKSEQHALTNIINCYLREFVIPHQDLSIDESDDDLPLCLRNNRADLSAQLLTIRFPIAHETASAKIVLPVAYFSHLGKCQPIGAPWLKAHGQSWICLDIQQLVDYLHSYIATRYQIDINQELKHQIDNSISVTTAFLQASANHATSYQQDIQQNTSNVNGYIASEQALLWGHAYHPSPKSRQGIDMASLLAHSPETQSQFALFWFKVDPSLVSYIGKDTKAILRNIARTLLADKLLAPVNSEINSLNTNSLNFDGLNTDSDTDWVYYPCHPWEADGILANPTIKRAIASGYMVPLGLTGKAVSPTSSVRTLYHDQLTHFIKCSIHVRLTNCIRKNAWYELHSAVYLNAILEKIDHSKRLTAPAFKLMLEPGATTLDMSAKFPDDDASSTQFITESFGLLFRESFTTDDIEYLTPQVAAALFTEDRFGDSVIERQLQQCCNHRDQHDQHDNECASYDTLACLWFRRYANILIDGTFDYFFNHGVVFEPHLQNTVIGFHQGLPTCVWIRDLEGTKLVDSLWSLADATGLSERCKQSIRYSRTAGWSRIAYCVFVNNLSEAIFYLCRGAQSAKTLEARLWQHVKEILINWQLVYGSQPEIQDLLDGGSLPSKTNYKTRLLTLADKHSAYVMLPCPWQPSTLTAKTDKQ
ncbi:IucA/IucC family protein [Psychrobacter immobilis]|jgi:siderophore synthetase component|uniref:IucA/IucC family protein n=1 Tax=Psychrobacter immobilis TaxID=498 RepID=UPI0028F06CB0|nr:IucA/IucC family protein [Psychrobacter immobilis]